MNELRTVGSTETGNAKLMIPADGHEFYFERIDYQTLSLHSVTPLDGVQQAYDESSTLEELPNGVRRAITVSQYRLRSTKTTLEGVMS